MAFIAFASVEAQTRFQSICRSLGAGFTVLDAKGGRVFAVSDMVLDELPQHDIPFTPLRETDLPQLLTDGGFAYYRTLRQKDPERLYFNVSLPAALHMTLACSVPEPNLEAVRQIVEQYEPISFSTEEVAAISILMDSDEPSDIRSMVRVVFTIPRKHQQSVMNELMESGAAGFSRETAIYIESDPDGPPRIR